MPTSPPQVRVPTSVPTFSSRNIHGSASPPEPAISLISIVRGPKICCRGEYHVAPSRVVTALRNGRLSRSMM